MRPGGGPAASRAGRASRLGLLADAGEPPLAWHHLLVTCSMLRNMMESNSISSDGILSDHR